MKSEKSTTTYLQDYREPDFNITHTELDIGLDANATRVYASHRVIKNNTDVVNLALDCEKIEIESVKIDNNSLRSTDFYLTDRKLIIPDVPDQFQLQITNVTDPSNNTALSGLYRSGDMLCTQCEAEGFRRITPAIDRPDNLAEYSVRLTANKIDYPILLCNGNLMDGGELDDSTHFSIWHDPFPKPSYLFAIVAGKLSCLEDRFETRSGRIVKLRFYARDQDINKCALAMASLKKAMAWDEQKYGREYDLDLFNVVAVDDFNMGAMENKSLNIFNTKYVLADSTMATDDDFQNVERVIGHEYFHNWSGNRITCRDWFQLSLKEGFTVFREQQFSADTGSHGVNRIDDVDQLRSHQFKEDASPMAHPVRPDSYQEINNFYTATVYNKGAEIVRMLHTLLGPEHFRNGTDLYFDKFDGQAATTDDFVACMEMVNKSDFTQFKNWYSQAGTPRVFVKTHYDDNSEVFTISMKQSCAEIVGQKNKDSFVIPIRMALFDESGRKMALDEDGDEVLLKLDKATQSFAFSGIGSSPTPSLLRQFSAPIELEISLNDVQLRTLLIHDDDPFNQWEAGQRLYLKQLLHNISCFKNNSKIDDNAKLIEAFRALLSAQQDDFEFLAKLIKLPSISYLSEQSLPIDPNKIELARRHLMVMFAKATKPLLLTCYHQCQAHNTGQSNKLEIGARALRDRCLKYLSALDDRDCGDLILDQLTNSRCMTDEASAIALIARSDRSDKVSLLNGFYTRWQSEPLVVDKWFRIQATVADESTLNRVIALTKHPGFDYTNPNKVYALILGFTHGNPYGFHAENGAGYEFLVHWTRIIDPINPQVSARLVSALNGWGKYKPSLREKMHHSLKEIAAIADLSNDVREIVGKNLH